VRERPRCRAVIVRDRIRPGVFYDTDEGTRARGLRPGEAWDGCCVVRAEEDGSVPLQSPIFPSEGIRKQLVLMLREERQ